MIRVLTSILVLTFAAPAAAAEVSVEREVLRFEAADGETNDVRIIADGDGLLVEDAGAALIAGAGCSVRGDAVRCVAARTNVYLGDGDDRFRGGDERDKVRGQLGADRIHGGGAHDYVIDRSPENDVLRGGAGVDVVAGVYGADRAYGGADRDILVVLGDGAHARGGSGPDSLALGRRPGRVDCGTGSDIIDPLGLRRAIPRSCEFFEVPFTEETIRARIRDGFVPVPECQLEAGRRCKVSVTVFDGDEVVARRTTRADRVRVPVSARARALGVRYRLSTVPETLEVKLRIG